MKILIYHKLTDTFLASFPTTIVNSTSQSNSWIKQNYFYFKARKIDIHANNATRGDNFTVFKHYLKDVFHFTDIKTYDNVFFI